MRFLQTSVGLIAASSIKRIQSTETRGERRYNQITFEIGGEARTVQADAAAVERFLDHHQQQRTT